MEKEIKSLEHPLVKRAVHLRGDRDARDLEKRVLISGQKLISDLSLHWPIEILFYLDDLPKIPSFESIRISKAILKKITGLEEPDGWAAIVQAPEEKSLVRKHHILILDQISDPGNLGTLWRTALGLGWEGIWLTPGCVDPFNDKALRAAQGTTFYLPFERILPEAIVSWAQQTKAAIYAADLQGSPLDQCTITTPCALILGNEGKGIGEWAKAIAKAVTIPISNVESLNVASAGAILLYAMRPKPRNNL